MPNSIDKIVYKNLPIKLDFKSYLDAKGAQEYYKLELNSPCVTQLVTSAVTVYEAVMWAK